MQEEWELAWEDYYEILQVHHSAELDIIKAAYRKLTLKYHPDRSTDPSAGDRMKKFNRAYEVLSDSEKRKRYHSEWIRRGGRTTDWQDTMQKPKPEVDPSSFHFKDVKPGEIQKASFIIKNAGGPYGRIWISNPDSWVRVVGYSSLTESDELPLLVDIEAEGRDWEEKYIENILVRLDEEEIFVKIELNTSTAPLKEDATVGARARTSRVRTTPQPVPRPFSPKEGTPTWLKWLLVLTVFAAVVVTILGLTDKGENEGRPVKETLASDELKWSYSISGDKTAAPFDLDSDGVLDELLVIITGKPAIIYAFTSDGKLKWTFTIEGSHSGHIAQHIASIDYDSDGKFDEFILDIRGNVNEPGVIVIGQPEVYTFNFFIINSNGEQLWYYQCANPEHAFLPGMSLKSPRCDAEEADALYQEKLSTYGYNINGQFIDQHFGRIDLDGDGKFNGIIRVEEDSINVYDKPSSY